MEQNDHDLLIEVKTILNVLVQNQDRYFTENKEINARMVEIETLRGADNARLTQIQDSVRQSLDNHTRINGHDTRLDVLHDEIKDLKKKSQIVDAINAVGAVIAGVIGFIFGSR